ncbi:MAG: mevalonate kinase [Polyangiaceae bacterium]
MTTASSGRASGKIILFGEHAVVHGAPGLAAGIERGATAHLEIGAPGPATLELGGRAVEPARDGDDLARAFAALVDAAPLPEATRDGFRVRVATEIAPGGGLGCSAAIGVSVARAIEATGSADGAEERAARRASAWEGVFHGNPSGIDTAAALSGGFFRFVRGVGATPIEHPHDLHFAIGYSGSSASTKEMVAGIARIKERHPDRIAKFVEAVGSLVRNAELAIAANDAEALGKLLDLNQMLLAGLMLSTDAIERMREAAKDAGSLGTKLTGSGGGGSVIALARDAEGARRIAEAWRAAGFDAFPTCVRARGHASATRHEPHDAPPTLEPTAEDPGV